MRIVVLGAGATGGYFGGRLIEAGADVTFLVRPGRRAQLAAEGLTVHSPAGDLDLKVRALTVGEISSPYDLAILSSKAYDLESAIETLAAAVGPGTAILPLLNGMLHFDLLDRRFGAARVLGGLCAIAATVDKEGHIRHLNPMHFLTYGERDRSASARVSAIAKVMAPVRFETRPSPDIILEVWEKWVLLATLAGATCTMRGAVGDIVAAGGADLVNHLLDECAAIAAAAGHAPRTDVLARTRAALTQPGSTFTASMLRDIENGGRIEADHILGDLLGRGRRAGLELPLLTIAHAQAKTYEARRAREATTQPR